MDFCILDTLISYVAIVVMYFLSMSLPCNGGRLSHWEYHLYHGGFESSHVLLPTNKEWTQWPGVWCVYSYISVHPEVV